MMKKLLSLLVCFALLAACASAEVRLADTSITENGKIAAIEAGAIDAYVSPYDQNIYYLIRSAAGYDVTILSEGGDFKTIAQLDDQYECLSIRADADGNVFVLRKNRDETAKSDILHLVADGDSYVSNSYPFPAATKELRPYRMEYSPLTSSGHVLMWLDNNGESVPALCVFNVFWGALQGFDSFIVVEPGSLNAEAVSMENLYDAYGYATDASRAFVGRIVSGELLSPTDASLSPDGSKLLLFVPYQGSDLLYVMDLYTLATQLVYPPDDFSGTVGWTDESLLVITYDDGKTEEITFSDFSGGDWDGEWSEDWSQSFLDEATDGEADWSTDDETDSLSDWS